MSDHNAPNVCAGILCPVDPPALQNALPRGAHITKATASRHTCMHSAGTCRRAAVSILPTKQTPDSLMLKQQRDPLMNVLGRTAQACFPCLRRGVCHNPVLSTLALCVPLFGVADNDTGAFLAKNTRLSRFRASRPSALSF